LNLYPLFQDYLPFCNNILSFYRLLNTKAFEWTGKPESVWGEEGGIDFLICSLESVSFVISFFYLLRWSSVRNEDQFRDVGARGQGACVTPSPLPPHTSQSTSKAFPPFLSPHTFRLSSPLKCLCI
jgi:hypothetical protein